ncbi:PKD domain-containing protein [bacterium]|nr:PKD domain-containing protein [bacterium]
MRREALLLVISCVALSLMLGGCINEEPIIDALDIPDANVDDTVTFSVIAHDADGDALTYTWTVDGTPLSGNTPTVTWKATKAGTVIVKVTVSDGNNSPVDQEKKLTILPKDVDDDETNKQLVDTWIHELKENSLVVLTFTSEGKYTHTHLTSDEIKIVDDEKLEFGAGQIHNLEQGSYSADGKEIIVGGKAFPYTIEGDILKVELPLGDLVVGKYTKLKAYIQERR